MMRIFLPVLFLMLAACGRETETPVPVSMDVDQWAILHSTNMPARPTQNGNGWYFDFPGPRGHVHYVMNSVRLAAKSRASADIEVTGRAPVFNKNPTKDPKNKCPALASMRLMIQRRGDNLTGKNGMGYYRWWSINAFYVLAPGQAQLAASLTDPSQWLSVFGERADSSPAARAGFEAAKADLGAVGFTFGGGCFYGHGVNVLGGTARFHVRSFAVQ